MTPTPQPPPLFDSQKSQKLGNEYAISLAIKTLRNALPDKQTQNDVEAHLYTIARQPDSYVRQELERPYGLRRTIDRDISEISKAFSERVAEILQLLQSGG